MILIRKIALAAAFCLAVVPLFGQGKYSGGDGDGFASLTRLMTLTSGTVAKYYGGSGDGFSEASVDAVWYVLARVNLWLEGAWLGGGAMRTDLKTGGSIPTTSPYTDGRTTDPVPSGITDWVLVELRGSDGTTVRSYRSFFLKSNGMLVDTDGSTMNCKMPAVGDGDYYIVVKHRNHLAVMSAEEQALSHGDASLYDFTIESGQYNDASGAKEIETGVWGAWAGDVNQDKVVTTTDYTSWYNSARLGESGYRDTDVNLDGVVTTSDYTMWYNNARLGASSTVP
ncbi:hypothetical protein JW777_06395 [bacterium]|nr:hypothetical protein [bacterium]